MPFVRRAPLLRMAAIGGVAYMGSKAGANKANQQAAAQQQQQAAAQPAPAAPAPAPAPAGPAESAGNDRIAQLKQIADLHDQGILTDDEFAAEKKKILGI
jgi:membrane protease subunit (stomatin/prohibitin family)